MNQNSRNFMTYEEFLSVTTSKFLKTVGSVELERQNNRAFVIREKPPESENSKNSTFRSLQ